MYKQLDNVSKAMKATDNLLMKGVSAVAWSMNLATGCTKSQASNSLLAASTVGLAAGLPAINFDSINVYFFLVILSPALVIACHFMQKENTGLEAKEINALKNGEISTEVEKEKSRRARGGYGYLFTGSLSVCLSISALKDNDYPTQIIGGILAFSLLSNGLSTLIMRTDYLPRRGSALADWARKAFRGTATKETGANLDEEK